MIEKRKKLTLKTPYNTLVKYLWNVKKSSSDLSKENIELKSKIIFRKEKTHHNPAKSNEKLKGRCGQELCMNMDLVEKLEQLEQANNSIKQKIQDVEGQHKEMIHEIENRNKIEMKVWRIERDLLRKRNKLRKQAYLGGSEKKKIFPYDNETDDNITKELENQEKKYNQLVEKVEQSDQKISRVQFLSGKLGKEIIKLIEIKSSLKKALKARKEDSIKKIR